MALSSPTLTELLSKVRNLLNQPGASNSFWSDSELTDYINEAVRIYFLEVAQVDEGYFLTQADLDIVANTDTVALPADCFQVRTLYKKVSNGYEALAYRNNMTEGYSTQGGTSSQSFLPYYYFQGNNLILRPTPNFSETGGLRLEYLQVPDALVNGTDSMTAQIAPIFRQLIEVYAVYKAKLKESMVNGVIMHQIPQQHMGEVLHQFRDAISKRSKNPTFIIPFNPEYT